MLSLIDTHVHFWDPAHLRYAWLAGSPSYTRSTCRTGCGAGRRLAAGTVGICAGRLRRGAGPGEVEWVSALAAEHPVISGIVAFAPLEHASAPVTTWSGLGSSRWSRACAG